MTIFNSLGSNYNLRFVLNALFSSNNQDYQKQLEQFLAKFFGGEVTLLYKGREALELALKNLNLADGSFVAINGFTCFAVYEAIKKAGLNVEYLDIDRGDLNFSADELQKHLNKNSQIRAVMIQNTLGYPADGEQIAKICGENNITLIEDLAHCVGTRYSSGVKAGGIGNVIVLSFSQDKMIDAISGGALINEGVKLTHLQGVHTKRQLIDRCYPVFTYLIRQTYSLGIGKVLHFILRNLHLLSGPMDQPDGQFHQLPSWYCHLINLAFARLSDDLTHRRNIACWYVKSINPKLISPKIANTVSLSSNLRFPIFVNNRASLIKYLATHQIFISDIWYDAPVAPKRYLQLTDYRHQCPHAELASDEIVNLPTSINVKMEDAEKISHLINQWLKQQ